MASTRIERVLRHDGIVAVLDMNTEQVKAWDPTWAGDEHWKPIVMEAVRLRQIANEPSVRVLVGDHAVLVSGDENHVVGVVFIKGHPVVKSVVRMVRQLLRVSPTKGGRKAATSVVGAPSPVGGTPASPPTKPSLAAPSSGGLSNPADLSDYDDDDDDDQDASSDQDSSF